MRKNKTKRGIVLSAVVLFGAVWIPEIRGNASAYLDQIEQETIEVDVQEDGSASPDVRSGLESTGQYERGSAQLGENRHSE